MKSNNKNFENKKVLLLKIRKIQKIQKIQQQKIEKKIMKERKEKFYVRNKQTKKKRNNDLKFIPYSTKKINFINKNISKQKTTPN